MHGQRRCFLHFLTRDSRPQQSREHWDVCDDSAPCAVLKMQSVAIALISLCGFPLFEEFVLCKIYCEKENLEKGP